MSCFCLRDYCCCCLYLFLAIVIIVLVVIVPTFCQQFWFIREANHSCNFTLIFNGKKKKLDLAQKDIFPPQTWFSLPLRTATVICEDGYQLKKPSNNKVRKIFFCTNIISEKYSFAQILILILFQLVCREDGSWTASLGYEFPRCQVGQREKNHYLPSKMSGGKIEKESSYC